MVSYDRRTALRIGASGLGGAVLGFRAEAAVQRVGILTGPATGAYYSLGKIVAGAITSQELLVSAISSNGAFSNVGHVGAPFADSALSQADLAFWAYTGAEMFSGAKNVDLRLIANCYTETVHVLSQKTLQIPDISKLAKRTIGVYAINLSEERNARLILSAHGLKPTDFTLSALTPAECLQQFKQGNIDAMFVTAAQRAAVVKDLITSGLSFDLTPFKNDARDQLIKAYPYFSNDEISANTYFSSPAIPTVGIGCQWLTTKSSSDDLIFALTRGLWSDQTRAELLVGFPTGPAIDKSRAIEGTGGVPLHPGALKFYKQEGLIK